jgi:hypothetical protein
MAYREIYAHLSVFCSLEERNKTTTMYDRLNGYSHKQHHQKILNACIWPQSLLNCVSRPLLLIIIFGSRNEGGITIWPISLLCIIFPTVCESKK